jgi:KUP system potassium uptake protein
MSNSPAPGPARKRELLSLSLAALGVVYGDIGTSPLYAVRQCFHGQHAVALSQGNVLGVLSLIFWALVVLISGKYMLYVLRADNHGEGGILALVALALSRLEPGTRVVASVTTIGLFGAALLYGDGVLTPAISVLSAVEGLEIAVPALHAYVVPITLAILVGLFAVQHRGTARVGAMFGPVTLVWFITIGAVGVANIAEMPSILMALDPRHAAEFLLSGGAAGFLVLGSVFLVVTGGETLYADMGHFGRTPMRLTWFFVAQPALLLNYFGQGARLLLDPGAVENPFFYSVPAWGRLAMVGIATAAAVIASQAVISGAFSVTRQATMLGYWPRVAIKHTSASQIGQIYAPAVNWALLIGTAALVLGFKSSTNLASAYGIAVSLTMLITAVVAHVVARNVWGWSRLLAWSITGPLLVADVSFFSANALKVADGGWVPLTIGVCILALMTTWKKGRALLGSRLREAMVTVDDFFELMRIARPVRVPGTAIFMSGTTGGVPPALMRNFEHNHAVHEHNVFLTVLTTAAPRVAEETRLTVRDLTHGFVSVEARYGFMEEPDVPAALKRAGLPDYDPAYATYFFGRETLLADSDVGMWRWRKRLFTVMSQNSERATSFFRIPHNQVVELGAQVTL